MCGRVVQSSGPLRYAIVDGMNVRADRLHNYPPRWNGAPSQDLLVIRRNHRTGEISLDPLRWGLIPYWCADPKGGRKPINAKCETVGDLPTFREAYRKRRCLVPVDGFFEWKAIKGRAKQPYAIAMKDHHHGRQRARRRHSRAHAAHPGAGALRALARRGSGPARSDASVSGRAHAHVADLDAGQQAGKRRPVDHRAHRTRDRRGVAARALGACVAVRHVEDDRQQL